MGRISFQTGVNSDLGLTVGRYDVEILNGQVVLRPLTPSDARILCETLLSDPPDNAGLVNFRTEFVGEALDIMRDVAFGGDPKFALGQKDHDSLLLDFFRLTEPGGALYQQCERVSRDLGRGIDLDFADRGYSSCSSGAVRGR
jgi:hypothetical protein